MRRVGMLSCGFMFVGGMVLLVLLAPGLFGPLGWGWGSGNYGWGVAPWVWGGFGFRIMGLGMLVFCLLMMGGMMMHGRPHAHGGGNAWMSMPVESLSEILQRRYTRGEITQEQFEQMRETLGLPDATSPNVQAHRYQREYENDVDDGTNSPAAIEDKKASRQTDESGDS